MFDILLALAIPGSMLLMGLYAVFCDRV